MNENTTLEQYEPLNNIALDFVKGENVSIGKFVTIEEEVRVGNNVTIKDYVRLGKGTVIWNDTFIDSYVKTSGECYIGKNCVLRYNVIIARGVSVGDRVFIAPNVMTIHEPGRLTVIEDEVKVYTSAVIDAGVVISKGSIIAAMSFVNKSCYPAGTYGGVPVRRLK